MLTQIVKMIADSRCGHAIPSAAAFSRDAIKWCFQAAGVTRSPIIISVENEQDMSLEEAAELTKKFAAMFPQVPAGLSLEHCEDFKTAMRAVLAGYTNIVMPVSCGKEALQAAGHLCRAAGARLEAEVTLEDECLRTADSLRGMVSELSVDGVFIRDARPADADGVWEVALARKLWGLYAETGILIGIRGEIFSDRECLKLAARTGLSRVTFSDSLGAAGIQAAHALVLQPEKDRRGLPKLQASVCEGFTKELSACMQTLNAHNRF